MAGHKGYRPGGSARFEAGKHAPGGRIYGRKSGKQEKPMPEPMAVVMFTRETADGPRVEAFWRGRKIIGHTEKGCAYGLIQAGAPPELAWRLYGLHGFVLKRRGEALSEFLE